MGKYSVSLEKEVVEDAKKYLVIGQKLSPIVNDLLKKWIEMRKKEEESK